MIHAYDRIYLSAAQKTLAGMLDYLVNMLRYSLEEAWDFFLVSPFSRRFEQGDCSVVTGMSGQELAQAVLGKNTRNITVESSYTEGRSREYWTGWAIAYYQWDTGLSFSEIHSVIPIGKIYGMYEPYHEMDIRQFVDKMNELYQVSHPETCLKTFRMLSGLSQAELAKQADVSVRTIQQYEQRQKHINKASGETILKLARALSCTMEELMEKVPGDRGND